MLCACGIRAPPLVLSRPCHRCANPLATPLHSLFPHLSVHLGKNGSGALPILKPRRTRNRAELIEDRTSCMSQPSSLCPLSIPLPLPPQHSPQDLTMSLLFAQEPRRSRSRRRRPCCPPSRRRPRVRVNDLGDHQSTTNLRAVLVASPPSSQVPAVSHSSIAVEEN